MLICLGAANALADPKRLLKAVPGALYEVGTAVVVALSVAPQLVESVLRVRRARRLRGGRQRGLRALRGIAMPVLVDALDRSLALAAAMDSRGYGRGGGAARPVRLATGALLVAGLLGVCVGVYGLLDGTSPGWLGLPMLLLGLLVAGLGLPLAGRRVRRSVYRPDPWRLPETLVAASGLVRGGGRWCFPPAVDPGNLYPSLDPLGWPGLPLAGHAGRARRAAAGLAGAPPPASVISRGPGGGARDPLRRGDGHVRRRARRRCCGTSRSPSTRASCAWSPAAPAVGQVHRCSARSTAWCRTSPAAGWPAGSPSPAWTPATTPPRELAHVVGVVGQDPLAGFVTDTVEDELAYTMEQLAVPPARDAQAGRGDARPARHRRAAPPSTSDTLRRAAAAGRHRGGADRAPGGAGAGRADLGAGPDGGRGGAGRDHPAGARPRHHRRGGRAPAGAGRAVRGPAGAADRRRRRGRRAAGRRAGGLAGRAAGRRAGPARRLVRRCRCRCATPAAGPPRCGPRWSPRRRRCRRPLGRRAGAHRRAASWSGTAR